MLINVCVEYIGGEEKVFVSLRNDRAAVRQERRQRMKQCHTSTYRGKRVIVRLRDGTSFIDRFEERKDSRIRLRQRGWIHKSELKSFTIVRGEFTKR